MKLVGQYLQLRGPTWLSPSSVEADITGGSNMSSQVQPKQEASTASSKNYTFRKGDRVKYVGSLPSGFSPTQTPIRGPTYGYRGKVVLAFEENGSSKIGVRFDRAIPEGNDLGGLCEEDHGFFCAADLLRLIVPALMTLKSSPLMNSLREKCLVGNPEAYAAFKIKLETLPENVDVIASHTQTDSRKEKSHPGGLLFTKFGSNQTALLDLAFPDNFGRLHDRSKETPKMKQLSRLFPNKVTIQIPQLGKAAEQKQRNSKGNEVAQPPFPKQSNDTDSAPTDLLRVTHHSSILRQLKEQALTNECRSISQLNLQISCDVLQFDGIRARFLVIDCFQERSDLPLESPEPVEFFSINHCFFPSSALKLDDDDDLPEALDTGRFPVSVTTRFTRRILNFMKLVGQYLQLVRGPTWLSPSSVEADITGGSNMSSQVQPKQEASTASSKNYTFRKGDRVKYVGSLPSGFSPTQTPIRGPTYGYRGKVVLAFEENGSSKIGVRFDRAIPEGNDLGGLCEEDHGFFCAADLLRLDSSSADDIEKLALMNSLRNVDVIASHTQTDSRKEKSHPGGLLFTKFGSNQTALLDLAFPDNFGRLHDRSKETPKTMKQLSRLFPNKVTIQIPQVLKRLLAGVYAITLCIPPELHPRSGNALFEVKVGVGFDKGIPEGNDFGASMKKIVCADCFQERSDLPLESPEPVEFFSINHCFFPSSALKLDDDDDLPEALDTGRFPVSVTTRRILNFMKLVGQYLQLVQPKQEASTASSKNYTFRKGDRVKYVGSLPSGFSPTQTPIRCLMSPP
ncbi:UNVERIFIED_CONTAM: hypothetical protein Scaly_3025300 [Sesamum calycinum]|uniref:Uncharacterized protein n=1 Tax=Sesamum calycinum TaxID=2727403 RepID=A0AAW2K6Z9_9LAMI